jgi:ureidoacrylate peracid hydrolase
MRGHAVDLDRIRTSIGAARGGIERHFATIDARRAVHVVIDLQNGFVEEGGIAEVPTARDIIPNVNAIAKAVREAGGRNVFVRLTAPANAREDWAVNWARAGDRAGAIIAALSPGAQPWQLSPLLDMRPEDTVIDKTRFGTLAHGTSDLQRLLEEAGADTLIVTGCVTNCCCETTAREACQLGYKVVFVADGNAAYSDEAHAAALSSLGTFFADLWATDEVVAALTREMVAA